MLRSNQISYKCVISIIVVIVVNIIIFVIHFNMVVHYTFALALDPCFCSLQLHASPTPPSRGRPEEQAAAAAVTRRRVVVKRAHTADDSTTLKHRG